MLYDDDEDVIHDAYERLEGKVESVCRGDFWISSYWL